MAQLLTFVWLPLWKTNFYKVKKTLVTPSASRQGKRKWWRWVVCTDTGCTQSNNDTHDLCLIVFIIMTRLSLWPCLPPIQGRINILLILKVNNPIQSRKYRGEVAYPEFPFILFDRIPWNICESFYTENILEWQIYLSYLYDYLF